MMLMPRRNNFDIWDDMFSDPFFHEENKLMKTDVKELDNKYQIDMDLPGFEKKDIKIDIDNGYLTIKAKSSTDIDDSKGKYIRRERHYGECSRSFYVGEDVSYDDIKASFKNGILSLTLPKKEIEEKPKKYIEIED